MKLGVFWRNLGNSATYYPRLAKATGGVTAAIFFDYLFQRHSQLNNPDEWVRITFDEIENKTGLTSSEQRLARHQLVERSLLQERSVNSCANALEFWPDIDAFEERLDTFGKSVQSDIKIETASRANTANELELRNHPNNLHLETSTEAIVETDTQERQKQKENVKNNGSSVIKSGTFHTKNLYPAIESSTNDIDTSTPPIKTDKFFPVQRQSISVKVAPNYQFVGPWESAKQFENFQRALLEYFKNKGVDSPGGWVFKIIDGMTKGLVSPFWDEFVAGIPLGESQKVKRDWDLEPGVPYPAFEEERIQYYIHKGEPLEVAVSKARSDLRNPVVGKDLWEGFLRKCDRVADEAMKAKNLGVATPYLPPAFTDKPQVTKQSVINKLAAVASQFLLSTSSLDSLSETRIEHREIEAEAQSSVYEVPTLASLQEVYKTPIGRTLVERQIAEHPEWGYGIVDGQVIDLIPF